MLEKYSKVLKGQLLRGRRENFFLALVFLPEAQLWHSPYILKGNNQSLRTFICGNRLFATDAHTHTKKKLKKLTTYLSTFLLNWWGYWKIVKIANPTFDLS